MSARVTVAVRVNGRAYERVVENRFRGLAVL